MIAILYNRNECDNCDHCIRRQRKVTSEQHCVMFTYNTTVFIVYCWKKQVYEKSALRCSIFVITRKPTGSVTSCHVLSFIWEHVDTTCTVQDYWSQQAGFTYHLWKFNQAFFLEWVTVQQFVYNVSDLSVIEVNISFVFNMVDPHNLCEVFYTYFWLILQYQITVEINYYLYLRLIHMSRMHSNSKILFEVTPQRRHTHVHTHECCRTA